MKILNDKSILITGAAGGLGFATSRECLSYGAHLTLVDHDEAVLDQAIQTLTQEYPEAKILKVIADVTREEQVKGYVDQALEVYGRIDGFYNNAGIEGRLAPLPEYDVDIFKKVVDVNVMGVYYGLRYVLPVMKEQSVGRIVNVSSVGGLRATTNHSAYITTKHAVAGVTKSAALEYGRYGVLTNAIAPGLIMTPMAEVALRQMNPEDPGEAEKLFTIRNPLGRLGRPEEIANIVVFMLSEKCGYMNGHVVVVDGGESIVFGPI
ncbi:MAG: SDR family oxidoreductase [Bacteroides sp.]|nr:SDR family oxidoreductase [Bacteroides sp.]